MADQTPAEWAMSLSSKEGTKSAAGLARAWMRTHEELAERFPHDRHHARTVERWQARHKAVLALEAIGFTGGNHE